MRDIQDIVATNFAAGVKAAEKAGLPIRPTEQERGYMKGHRKWTLPRVRIPIKPGDICIGTVLDPADVPGSYGTHHMRAGYSYWLDAHKDHYHIMARPI